VNRQQPSRRGLGRIVLPRPQELVGRVSTFSIVLFLVLFLVNFGTLPSFVSAANLPSTLADAAPLVLAAMATTPAILSGGGGIDVSIGPLMGLVNAVLVAKLVPAGVGTPEVAVPVMLAIGLSVGLVNGLVVSVLRVQPIVATLASYLVLTGITLTILPQPSGTAPSWINTLGASIGPVPGSLIIVVVPVAAWTIIWRGPFRVALLGVGGDERAAFTAGVNVTAVRIIAYGIGGLLAAIAGIALTALVGSGDPTLGPQYTLIAIAAAAFGGTSLAGGRGGMTGSVFAALDIYLIQSLLSALKVPSFWLQIVYGGILVVSLIANFGLTRLKRAATR
jgi:ribose transport system permease protein